MVYSQPAYIIKCTSDKGWLCLCFSNGTTLPFFLSPFLQALFEWNPAISLPPFFFIPLVIASVSGAQLACFCREGRKKKKKKPNPNGGVLICRSVRPTWMHSQVLPLQAGCWGFITPSTVSQSFLRGCERLQDHSRRLLTEAAIGSDKKKKKKGSIPTGPAKIIGIKAEGGGCSRQGCYQSAQVSPEMLQNAESLKFAWASPGLAPSSWMLIVKQLADSKGKRKEF